MMFIRCFKTITSFFVLCFSTTELVHANEITTLDKLVAEWSSIEKQRNKLESGWIEKQSILNNQIKLFNAEKNALINVVEKSQETNDEVEVERLKLLEQQTEMELDQSKVDLFIQQSFVKIKEVHPQLPPPLSASWEIELATLNQEGLSNSEKLELILLLLKQINEFESRVALNKSTMNIPSGDGSIKKVQTTQVYLGLSQGWYVSTNGKHVGYGRPTPNGWTWWHDEMSEKSLGDRLDSDTVHQVIQILEDPSNARFVSLPINLEQFQSSFVSQVQ